MSNPLASPDNVIHLRRPSAPGADVPAAPAQPLAHAALDEDDDDGPATGADGQERGQQRALQRRRAWLRECAVIAISYALNGFFIGLFAFTGTVSWMAGLMYALPGCVISAVTAHLIASGRTVHFKDPSVSLVHTAGSASLCVLGVGLFPQMAFAYGLMLFTTFITATYRMPKRQV
jgi:hypothetical protein